MSSSRLQEKKKDLKTRQRHNGNMLSELTRDGLTHFENQEFEFAAKYLSEALALDPENTDLLTTTGLSYLESGKVEEAAVIFSELSEKDPDDHLAFRSLARAMTLLEDWTGAGEALRECLDINPGDTEVLNDLGVIEHMKGEIKSAERFFLQSLETNPQNEDAKYNLGLIHLESGQYTEAAEFFSDISESVPQNQQIRMLLAETFILGGRLQEAIEELERIAEDGSGDAEYYCLKGRAYYGVRKMEEAEESFRACLIRSPSNIVAKESLAITLLRAGKDTEALEIWESLLKMPVREKVKRISDEPRFSEWEKISPFSIVVPTTEVEDTAPEVGIPSISVVVPVLNESPNIEPLTEELCETLDQIGGRYEMIFIDDGSNDDTMEVLKRLKRDIEQIRILSFRRNYGQTAAISAGFHYARGDVVITIDGDLQNDPKDIPLLLEKLAEGYDMVSGWREHRKDKFLTRKIPSLFANLLIGRITGTTLHDYGCSLKAYKKGIIKNIKLYGEMHRFIPAVVSWLGAEIAEIPVNHRHRVMGVSKYGLSRTLRVILDLINVKFLSSYLTRPLQYFGKLGFIFFLTAAFTVIITFGARYFLDVDISNTILFLTTIFMVLMGFQFITIGLIAEIIIRTYHESQEKPIYVLKEVID